MYKYFNKIIEKIAKRFNCVIISPNYKSFGNCAEEIFYGLLKAERENKFLILIYPKFPFQKSLVNLINKELFYLKHERIISKSIWVNCLRYFCGSYLILLHFTNEIYRITRPKRYVYIGANAIPSWGKSSLWTPDNLKGFDYEKAEQLEWKNQYSRFSPPEIEEAKLESARNELNRLGLPYDAWFVTLHVPEPIGHKNVRQASIKNYHESIKHITSNGGWVIRIGDSRFPSLNEFENVIDYAHDSKNLPIVNLFALSKCRFFIGVTSGPSLVASLFGTTVIGTNRTQLSHDYPFFKSIMKHIYDKEENVFLSIEDIINRSSETQFFEDKDETKYELFENTSDEILDIVKDALEEGEITSLMREFDSKIKETIKRFIVDEDYPKKWRGVESSEMYFYKYRAFAESPICLENSFINHEFLKNNWTRSSYNRKKE